MEKIKITFLGTGSMIPSVKRSHTAILLTYKNENILIDCGESTQRQFKFAGISPCKLTRILITHWHGDHILGLPGLFQTLGMSNYSNTLQIYGPQKTRYFIGLIKELVNIPIHLDIHEISSGKIIDEKEFCIEAAQMRHGIPTLAFSFATKDKLRIDREKIKKLNLPNSPLLGKLQEGKDVIINNKKIKSSQVTYTEKGKKVTFILDTAPNENAVTLAENSDILICESSFSEEEKELAEERLHLTTTDAAELAKNSKTKLLILTHISQRYEHAPQKILEETKKIFKNVKLVKDFETVEI